MSLLAIDVGTTGSKAAAFSEAGDCLGLAYREHRPSHPREGWAELDSLQIVRNLREIIAEVATRSAKDPITAVCISALGEAVTPVCGEGKILGTSILSSDTRGGKYIEALAQEISPEDFYAINPNILGLNYTLPKLSWLREHEPELYRQTDKFLYWSDLVACVLGCEPVTNYSHANRSLLFDIRRGDWSDRLLGIAGIDREKLPRVVPSGTIVGEVSRNVAAELGLPAGVKVVVGGHDQCCNSLGAGIYQAGNSVCGIGTFECVTPAFDRIPDAASMRRHGLNVEHHVLPDLYVSFIYNQGGVLVRWFCDTFASADSRLLRSGENIYDVLAAEVPTGPTRLLTLPYFEITGPPDFVSAAAGVIVGLKTSTTRGEILKSIMECVTFYFVDSVLALNAMGFETKEFIATGGGAKSDEWLQIKADIFNVPFVRLRSVEGSLLGAAILAGVSTGVWRSPAEGVAQFVKREREFEPDGGRHQIYQAKLETYRALFPLLKDFLAQQEQGPR